MDACIKNRVNTVVQMRVLETEESQKRKCPNLQCAVTLDYLWRVPLVFYTN